MRKEPKGKRRVDIKLLCNECGLNKILYHRQQQDDHWCPLCDEDREDRNHLLTHPHFEATKFALKRIAELEEKMKKFQTNSKLSKFILKSLRHIRKRQPVWNSSLYNFGIANVAVKDLEKRLQVTQNHVAKL